MTENLEIVTLADTGNAGITFSSYLPFEEVGVLAGEIW